MSDASYPKPENRQRNGLMPSELTPRSQQDSGDDEPNKSPWQFPSLEEDPVQAKGPADKSACCT
jgi:hypothetical protein